MIRVQEESHGSLGCGKECSVRERLTVSNDKDDSTKVRSGECR